MFYCYQARDNIKIAGKLLGVLTVLTYPFLPLHGSSLEDSNLYYKDEGWFQTRQSGPLCSSVLTHLGAS